MRRVLRTGGSLASAAVLAFAFSMAGPPASLAQDGTIAGGLLGAGAGAIIGGIAGGKKGVGRGAAIGAVTGAVIGTAAEHERRQRYYAAPPPAYAPAYATPYAARDPLVYEVQTSLYRLGYDPGPIDGLYGRRTGDAIAAYEHDNGLRVTGQPSQGLLNHMVQRGG
jgi:hypothetical protein